MSFFGSKPFRLILPDLGGLYGRFLPQDKAALAAQILNKVWEAA